MRNFFDWINRAFEDKEPKDLTITTVTLDKFKKRKAIPTVTPSESLFALSILLLTDLSKTIEQHRSFQQEIATAYKLKELGFTQSYEVAKIEQYNKNVKLLMFMCQMWQDLGPNTILISHKQFHSILRDYDMMCVPFRDYKGDIPEKNMHEIENAVLKVSMNRNRYSLKSSDSDIVIYAHNAEELIDNIRYPFFYVGRPDFFRGKDSMSFLYKSKFESPIHIAAPKAFVEEPEVFYDSRHSFEKRYSDEGMELRRRADKILQDVSKLGYAATPRSLPRYYDPFIFSNCNEGVIIHSMWGSEAEYTTINRYKQLRDFIIGNVDELIAQYKL